MCETNSYANSFYECLKQNIGTLCNNVLHDQSGCKSKRSKIACNVVHQNFPFKNFNYAPQH